MVAVVSVIALYFMRKKKKEREDSSRMEYGEVDTLGLEDAEKALKDVDPNGDLIDLDDFNDRLEEEEVVCARPISSLDPNRPCPPGFVPSGGCCLLPGEEGIEGMVRDMSGELAKELVAGMIIDAVAKVADNKIKKVVAKRASKKATKKLAAKIGSEAIEEIAEKKLKQLTKLLGSEAADKVLKEAAEDTMRMTIGEGGEDALKKAMKEAFEEVLDKAVTEATTASAEKKAIQRIAIAAGNSLDVVEKKAAKAVNVAMRRASGATKTALRKGGSSAARSGVKKAGSTIATAAAKAASSKAAALSGKAASKVTSKIAATRAAKLAVQQAGKMAARLARIAGKCNSPVGAALAVLDLISMAVDILDPAGYNNFVSNEILLNARNVAERDLQDRCKINGDTYPVLFPVQQYWEEEWGVATEKLFTDWGARKGAEAFRENETAIEFLDFILSIEKVEGEPDVPYVTEEEQPILWGLVYDAMEKSEDPIDDLLFLVESGWHEEDVTFAIQDWCTEDVFKRDVSERDTSFLSLFTSQLPEDQREDFAVYPTRSSLEVIGVSLSRSGAAKWNDKHRQDWLRYHDFFDNVVVPDDYARPDVCLFTDKYRVLDEDRPGTSNAPTMIEKTLPEGDMPLAVPLGHIVSFCEKVKNVGIMGSDAKLGEGVDPYALGCRFDFRSGTCHYTKAWCTRMGLEFDIEDENGVSNCFRGVGTSVVGFILGDTISNSLSRIGKTSDMIEFKDAEGTRRTPLTKQCGPGDACTKDEHCVPPARCRQNEYGQKVCS